jgi:MarC family membrane protein
MAPSSFLSAVVLLVLVTDPLGNIPPFVHLLRQCDPARKRKVILREVLFATVVLAFFAVFGQATLRLMNLTDSSLGIAGGVILFLIALRMIFAHPEDESKQLPDEEPFLVPLAIPLIAGPSSIATVLLLVSDQPHRRAEWLGALAVAMAVSTVVLVFAERIAHVLGRQVTQAFERLMGLILTAISVQMLLEGIRKFLRQG